VGELLDKRLDVSNLYACSGNKEHKQIMLVSGNLNKDVRFKDHTLSVQ